MYVCAIQQCRKTGAGCCSLLWTLTFACVICNMGKGSLTFSRIMLAVDGYHILQTSACFGPDVLPRRSTSYLLDIFWPLVHVEVSVTISSFTSYWSSILHYFPKLSGKQSIIPVLLEGICFFPSRCFLVAPILSSFHPPPLLRREHNLSLEG